MYLKSLKLFYFKPYFFFTLGQVIICSKAVPSLFANRGILLSKPLFLDIKYKIILEKQSCIDLFISPIRESNPYLPQDRWKSQHKGWNESSLPTLLSFFFWFKAKDKSWYRKDFLWEMEKKNNFRTASFSFIWFKG